MGKHYRIGDSADHAWDVVEAQTVRSHGTVDAPVLATPHLIFMLEDTCVLAVAATLEQDKITLGTAVHMDHLAATRVGERVDVHAELVAVRGRRLVFRAEARCGKVVVARCLHERAVVDKAQFLASVGAA